MATLQQRIEARIGAVTETELMEASLQEALHTLYSVMPDEMGRQYSTQKSGLGSAGVPVRGETLDIRVGDRKPKIVPSHRAKDVVGTSDSIYAASALFPAAWLSNGEWKAYPTTETIYVECLEAPTVAPSDNAIASAPNGAEELSVLYACWNLLMSRLSKTLAAPTAPTVDASQALADLISQPLVQGTVGSLTDQINESTWFSTLGQLIENEEDPELAARATQRIQTFIQAAGTEAQESNQTYSTEVQAWAQEVQKLFGEAERYRGAYNEKLQLMVSSNDRTESN